MKNITGADLRAMRLYGRVTIVQLIEAAGVKTRKTYMNWEKNIGTPNVNQLMQMLKACDINVKAYFKHVFNGQPETTFDMRFIHENCTANQIHSRDKDT